MKPTIMKFTDWFKWLNRKNRWVIAVLLLLTVFAVISASAVKINARRSGVQQAPTPVPAIYGAGHHIPSAY